MIEALAWRPADNLTLEPNALRAAKEQQDCLALTAGPGAGKTEMLAQRADFLLRTGTCRYPKRILAISFKVDASKNLKERVQRRCGSELSSRFDSYTFHAFAKRIIDKFRPVLSGEDALDPGYQIGDRRISRKQIEFRDLVPFAIQILTQSAVARNAIRQSYSDVFLDEFQDCTDQQYDLIKTAFLDTSIRLTAVGDTKQKIMGWAGALDGIFLKFAQDFDAVPLNMYRNFRSKPRLLRMQNDIIRVLDPQSVMADDQVEGNQGEVLAFRYSDSHAEAEHLANLVAEWVNNDGVPLSEIAILVSKQLDLYAGELMTALEARGIPYRNEQQMQDITVEPAARLVVDFLSSVYGNREPKAWMRLMSQLIPYADEDIQANARQDLGRFITSQRKSIAISELLSERYDGWWDTAVAFLRHVGTEALASLSPDYESHERLLQVLRDTKARIEELLKLEPDLPKALLRFSDDQAVRILTIHKSKGLEFDSVIILAVDNEIFFGDQDANRCAFFVGVSRAKRRLALTFADTRSRPQGHTGRWSLQRTMQEEYFSYAVPHLNA
ncbi:UvrD/REP helicase [Pseudomonas sp. Os17]|uniref:ATP-dependent helicase n=1 Tax=Pseudomonas sp. Os17 TaxID=1500686 RepID=UPI0005FC5907|nr:ATP-dependent helicase [Pseudomonas sp. Os17]BAQ74697.1 UvrD/REP helicase [Pseudomonas sp. Os17]